VRLPVLKPEHIKPHDAKLSTADAKRVFRQFMLHTNFLAKEEIADHTRWFVQELREHEAFLKEELARVRDDSGRCVEDSKVDIQDLQRELRKETDPAARAELQAELEDAERELAEHSQCVKKAEEEYRTLREDKRAFLVDYINRQTQG
jgi:hypothetical protein